MGKRSEVFDGVIVRISPETEQDKINEGEVQDMLAKEEAENCEKELMV